MKSLTVFNGGNETTITAPEGKAMVINESALANGILSITEYGPSGIKIAAFREWSEVIYDAADHGYTIVKTAF